MAQHSINITVLNEGVGIPTDQDGIMGLIMQGVAVASTLALDTPYLITSPADAAELGINAAYDVTNETAVFQQINEFYNQAGEGAYLWIQVTATGTAYAAYVAAAGAAFDNFIKFSQQADPTMGVKIVGLCYQPPTVLQQASDFPADVPATVTAAQTKQENMFAAGYYYSVIVDGYNMSSTQTVAGLGTQATNSAFFVSLCVTGTLGNGVSSVGLALGKASRISVGHGWGAVADGAINTTQAFLTNGIALYAGGTALTVGAVYTVMAGVITYNAATYQPGQQFTAVAGHTVFTTTASGYLITNSTPIGNSVSTLVGLDEATLNTSLGAKQYLYITSISGISGLFWNDGSTCTASTNFFSDQAYCRVMNHMAWEAKAYFTAAWRGQTLPSDPSGALESSFIAAAQAEFYKKFIQPLNANSGTGDISDGAIIITAANYSANGDVAFTIKLERSTQVGTITGQMSFVLSLTS